MVDAVGTLLHGYVGVVGVTLIIAAVVLAVRRVSAVVSGETAPGRVVGHHASTIDDSTTYQAIIEYRDRSHGTHRVTAGSGGATPAPPAGAIVRVRYQRTRPHVAFVPTFMHMWAAPLALATLGVAALVAWWRP